MNSEDFDKLPEKELLKRIYAAQLRMMMDIEKIHQNVIAIREKVDAEAFETEQMNETGDNPYGFRHLVEIHETFDQAFGDFPKQLDENE